MAIPKNVFLGLIYKFPFTGITALRLCVLTSKNVRLYALTHERNAICLPRQKAFLLAFWAKIGQNKGKSGFQMVEQPSGSPILCYQDAKTVDNAGVLFAFLCSAKIIKKVRVGRI